MVWRRREGLNGHARHHVETTSDLDVRGESAARSVSLVIVCVKLAILRVRLGIAG
jgi:hypothetical protein